MTEHKDKNKNKDNDVVYLETDTETSVSAKTTSSEPNVDTNICIDADAIFANKKEKIQHLIERYNIDILEAEKRYEILIDPEHKKRVNKIKQMLKNTERTD